MSPRRSSPSRPRSSRAMSAARSSRSPAAWKAASCTTAREGIGGARVLAGRQVLRKPQERLPSVPRRRSHQDESALAASVLSLKNTRGAAAWPLLGLLGRRFSEVAPAASGPARLCLLTIASGGHFIHHPFSVDCATSRKIRRLYSVSEAGSVPLCIKRRPREPAL